MKKIIRTCILTITLGISHGAHSNCYQDCATFNDDCKAHVDCFNHFSKAACSNRSICPSLETEGSCCRCMQDCDAKTYYHDPEEHAQELERRHKVARKQDQSPGNSTHEE